MDVIVFLKERTSFIRQLYRETSTPYFLRLQKIENKEEPFVPPCWNGEDDEPPFLTEYLEAQKSLDTLRLMYISMVKSVLHSYFVTWEKQIGIKVDDKYRKKLFNKGWFQGYSRIFKEYYDIDFQKAPVNLKTIEAIILTRNRIEHSDSIIDILNYSESDYEILQDFAYIDDFSRYVMETVGTGTFTTPSIAVTEEQLLSAITAIEDFTEWFNKEIESKPYHR